MRHTAFYLHVGDDSGIRWRWASLAVPRVGETLRVPTDRYAIVTEVIWCFDEQSDFGQRVNIRALLEPSDPQSDEVP